MKPTKKKTKPVSKAGSSNPMDVDFLQRLCDLMESNHLNAVELRDGERRIILRRFIPLLYTGDESFCH